MQYIAEDVTPASHGEQLAMIYPNRKRGNRKLVVLVGLFQEREAGTLGHT